MKKEDFHGESRTFRGRNTTEQIALDAKDLAATGLVPWLPTPLIDGFIADYLQQPVPESPLFSVIYEIAALRPERLRPHAAQIDHPWLRRGMLSGAPEGWVTDLVARWHAEHDPDVLDSLPRICTPAAADALLALPRGGRRPSSLGGPHRECRVAARRLRALVVRPGVPGLCGGAGAYSARHGWGVPG